METKKSYLWKIIKTVLVAFVAGNIGYFLFQQDMMMAVAFAGLPAGWRVLSNFFGRWIITGYLLPVYLCIKAALACMLGWIILPIDLILTVIKLVKAPRT